MSVVKSTWMFSQNNRGWTESLVKDIGASNDITGPQNTAILVAQKRAPCMGGDTTIIAVRTSLERDIGGADVVGDALLNYVSIQGSNIYESDAPDTALQLRFNSQFGLKHKMMFMRGIWDNISVSGGQITPPGGGPFWPEFLTKLNSYIAIILANGYGWWGNDPGPKAVVTTYDMNAPSLQVQLTVADPIFAAVVGKIVQVRFQGINGRSPLNGTQIVMVDSATTCHLVKPLAVGPFVSTGFARLYTRSVRQPVSIEPQRIVERKAGAPLLASRGRQRARPRV